MALMYARAAVGQAQRSKQRDHFLRARAYVEAALRDFQHYQGRAAAEEARVQGLLSQIDQGLANLPV
jgi:hypothetical protein